MLSLLVPCTLRPLFLNFLLRRGVIEDIDVGLYVVINRHIIDLIFILVCHIKDIRLNFLLRLQVLLQQHYQIFIKLLLLFFLLLDVRSHSWLRLCLSHLNLRLAFVSTVFRPLETLDLFFSLALRLFLLSAFFTFFTQIDTANFVSLPFRLEPSLTLLLPYQLLLLFSLLFVDLIFPCYSFRLLLFYLWLMNLDLLGV